jgi:hypothetical protein
MALTFKMIDAYYGPLTPGVDYSEGYNGAINVSKAWIADNIVTIQLFDGKKVKVHRKIAESFAETYRAAVENSGYHPIQVQTYNARHINNDPDKSLSYHSYGIAVDFDPGSNPRGQYWGKVENYPAFIETFERRGWVWGGRWKGDTRDTMHFQFTGTAAVVESSLLTTLILLGFGYWYWRTKRNG